MISFFIMNLLITKSPLRKTLDVITDAVNRGHSVDLLPLGFAKAFDKVSHEKLLL